MEGIDEVVTIESREAHRGRFSRVSRARPTITVVGLVFLFAKSALGSLPDVTPGSQTCRELRPATTLQYQTGEACPPAGFSAVLEYEPVLVLTPAGWRYMRPESADGGCSGPMADDGPFWHFGDACRAHDYGYDLVRLGIGDRRAADVLLYRDMKWSCAANSVVGVWSCRALADSAHAVLWTGDMTGFQPHEVGES